MVSYFDQFREDTARDTLERTEQKKSRKLIEMSRKLNYDENERNQGRKFKYGMKLNKVQSNMI